MDEKEIVRIKEHAQSELLKIPGVHAVGVGSKEVSGKLTGDICIKVYVVEKKALGDVPPEERIPPEIEGVSTDVSETPVPTLLQLEGARAPFFVDSERYRPLRGGIQVSRVGGNGFGTLGFFLTVQGSNQILGVTCHHVLYAACADTPDNEVVGQPSEADSCTDCCSSVIGRVVRSVCDDDLDITLIQLSSGQEWMAEVQQMGLITGGSIVTAADAASGTFQVRKRGRTTGLTGGVVEAVEVGVTMSYKTYEHMMVIRANADAAGPDTLFARHGDSGSAVVNDSGQVVGLLCAASGGPGGKAYATPLDLIITKFGLMPGDLKLQLSVATATTLNDVRVVARTALDPVLPPSEAPQPVPDFVPQLEKDLAQTEVGRRYVGAYLKHAHEVRDLINANRRVATNWHRSGAAELFQSMVQVVRRREARVPEQVRGRPIADILQQMGNVLAQYGSIALRQDLALVHPSLLAVAGLTYAEILGRLEQVNATSVA